MVVDINKLWMGIGSMSKNEMVWLDYIVANGALSVGVKQGLFMIKKKATNFFFETAGRQHRLPTADGMG